MAIRRVGSLVGVLGSIRQYLRMLDRLLLGRLGHKCSETHVSAGVFVFSLHISTAIPNPFFG
jgi:hypothetical protein